MTEMSIEEMRAMIASVIEATKQGALTWEVAMVDGYVTHLTSGRIELSNIVSDQREGDFCWFRVYSKGNVKLGERSITPALFSMISRSRSPVTAMLAEIHFKMMKG
jgi:hypothetical protein